MCTHITGWVQTCSKVHFTDQRRTHHTPDPDSAGEHEAQDTSTKAGVSMDLDNLLTDQLTGTTFEVGDVHLTAVVPA